MQQKISQKFAQGMKKECNHYRNSKALMVYSFSIFFLLPFLDKLCHFLILDQSENGTPKYIFRNNFTPN